jgi:hypothetical protein
VPEHRRLPALPPLPHEVLVPPNLLPNGKELNLAVAS